MTAVVPETGETFSAFFGDGLATHIKTADKMYEDFIQVDGKHYKLDVTRLNYTDYVSRHVFTTET